MVDLKMIVFKTNIFKNFTVLLMIVKDDPLFTILNNDPS